MQRRLSLPGRSSAFDYLTGFSRACSSAKYRELLADEAQTRRLADRFQPVAKKYDGSER